MSAIDTRRIATNTLMLYLRMGLIMLIGLYTSRVILDALGEVDMGVYNAVGGIVLMFSFACGTLTTSCQRFLMVDLGKEDSVQLRQTFNLCLISFVALLTLTVIISEPFGLWFMEKKMLLAGRTTAARWVFHCSILTFFVTGISLPYQAMIIAREKMNAFAYLSIIEALGALAIALAIRHTSADRLILYAVLMFVMRAVVTLLYVIYCLRHFKECRFQRTWDPGRLKEILSFSGWNLLGTSAGYFKTYGTNLLLNIFYGPAINAAVYMATKVYSSITQLREHFMTASKPQIIKSYSGGEHDDMKKLVFQSARFSTYLMLFIAIPFLLEMPFLLDIWLKDVPAYTSIFAILMLVNALLEGADYPIMIAIQANGNIRNYQIVVGSVQLMLLPVCYLLLKFGTFPPQVVFYVAIAISICAFFARMYFARKLTGITLSELTRRALIPMFLVTCIPVCLSFPIHHAMPEGWMRLICVTLTSVVVEIPAIYLLGMTRSERETVVRVIRRKLSGIKKKRI